MARVIDDIDLLDLDLYEFGDPHEVWSRLRKEAPVYWNVSQSGPEFWAITRYADCRRVLDDAATFSSERWGISLMVLEQMQLLQMLQGADAPPATCVKDFFHTAGELTSSYGAGAEMGLPMIMTDPPRHLQRRRVINKMFTPRAVRDRLGPLIQRFAKQAVDNVIDRGECEFVYDIGHTVPARVTLGLLGVPEDDFDLMTEIEHKMITGSDADLAGEPTGETTFIQQLALTEYFSPLIKERARQSEGRSDQRPWPIPRLTASFSMTARSSVTACCSSRVDSTRRVPRPQRAPCSRSCKTPARWKDSATTSHSWTLQAMSSSVGRARSCT